MKCLLVLSCLSIGLAGCDDPDLDRGEVSVAPRLQAELDNTNRLEASLQKQVVVDFVNVPLDEAMVKLSTLSQTPIVLIVPDDEPGERGPKTLVSAHGRMSLQSCLNQLLEQELIYEVAHGSILITRQRTTVTPCVLRVYDVSELFADLDEEAFPAQVSNPLIALLKLHVATSTWGDGTHEPGEGQIEVYGRQLVVSQTLEAHAEIKRFLAILHQARRNIDQGDLRPLWVEHNDPRDATTRLGHGLQQKVRLTFDQTSLVDIVKQLNERYGLPVTLELKAFEEAGIDPRTEVTFHGPFVSLQNGINLLCRANHLTFIVKNHEMLLTTRGNYCPADTLVVYPAPDLAADLSRFEQLDKLMQDLVAPTSWEAVGGSANNFYYAPLRSMIIQQTPDSHEQIEEFLARLRHAAPKQTPNRTQAGASHAQADTRVYDLTKWKQAVRAADGKPESVRVAPDEKTRQEVLAAVKSLVAPTSWNNSQNKLLLVGDELVVQQTSAAHTEVARLLRKLGYSGISRPRVPQPVTPPPQTDPARSGGFF